MNVSQPWQCALKSDTQQFGLFNLPLQLYNTWDKCLQRQRVVICKYQYLVSCIMQRRVCCQKFRNVLPWCWKTWPEGVLFFPQMSAACTTVTWTWNKTAEIIKIDVRSSFNRERDQRDVRWCRCNWQLFKFCSKLWKKLQVKRYCVNLFFRSWHAMGVYLKQWWFIRVSGEIMICQ